MNALVGIWLGHGLQRARRQAGDRAAEEGVQPRPAEKNEEEREEREENGRRRGGGGGGGKVKLSREDRQEQERKKEKDKGWSVQKRGAGDER